MKFKKPTQEMLDHFKQRTKEHIDRVVKYMGQLEGFDNLDAVELQERAQQHDRDKYSKELVLPYLWVTEYHRVNNEEGSVPDDLQEQYDLASEATGKHVKQNQHHPEAHEALSDMTELDLAEMVADWSAMAEELGEGSCRGWADKNVGSKWKFSPEQEEFIYGCIDWLENKAGKRKEAMLKHKGRLYRQADEIYEKRQHDVGRVDPPVATIDVYRTLHGDDPLVDPCTYYAYLSEVDGQPYDGSYGVSSYEEGETSTEAVRKMVDQWARAGFLE